jgi:hypothetical protein
MVQKYHAHRELSNPQQMSISLRVFIARGHDMGSSQDVSPCGPNSTTYLKKITDLLGCSIDDLILDKRSLHHAGQVELLRVWSLLPDDSARMQLLAAARTLAAVAKPTAAGYDQSQTGRRPSGE